MANLAILVGLYRSARQLRPSASLAAADLDRLLAGRGLISRLLRPVFALIGQSWHMYPLGFLFGLGFDTATEIALLDVSATEATQGLAIASVMVLPMLFTVGMLLADTLDGIVMTGAYGWAVSNPVRTFYYNLTITSASVMVALIVGGIEVLGLIGRHLGGEGEFWRAVVWLNDNLGNFGFIIIAVFAASWLVSVGMSRWRSGVELADGG